MEAKLDKSHLIIVCGVPGSGKSTFALRATDRWGAIRFASETFAEELGANARTATGDLSKQAIAHAYSAMGAAAAHALASGKQTVVAGSFRTKELRSAFREIAENAGANVTTLRITCSADTAAERVNARLALGERGPSHETIVQIAAELDAGNDIDLVLPNNSSLRHFYEKIDAVMDVVRLRSDNDLYIDIRERLQQLGADERPFTVD